MKNMYFSLAALYSLSTILFYSIAECQSPPSREDIQRESLIYYTSWIGVQAPELGTNLTDARENRTLQLRDYRGMRVLLFSFDAGDFVNEPEIPHFIEELRAVSDLSVQHEKDLGVVGFTYGVMFFMPNRELPPNIKAITRFPIVNNHKWELPEPYNLLQRWPSAILIDKKGIIIGIYQKPVSVESLATEMKKQDWQGEVREAPREGPPAIVKNYSQRKPWFIFSYGKALDAGTLFRRAYGRRTKVYTKEEMPEDVINLLSEVDGKTLKVQVREKEPIRKSHFDMK